MCVSVMQIKDKPCRLRDVQVYTHCRVCVHAFTVMAEAIDVNGGVINKIQPR